jgi:hypothetical protein
MAEMLLLAGETCTRTAHNPTHRWQGVLDGAVQQIGLSTIRHQSRPGQFRKFLVQLL